MGNKPTLADLLTANAQTRSGSGRDTETNTRLIDVYDITPSASNFYDISDIANLKQSIELIGLQQNLVVKELGGGKYELISGHRRLRACRELADEGNSSFRRALCKVSTAADALIERLELIMSNSTARQLSDWEQIRQARELRKILTELKERSGTSGRVRDLVAEIMNVSAAKVGRLDAIDRNLVPEFKAKLESGDITVTAAYEISGLTQDDQDEAFAEYEATGKVTVEQAKALKRASPPPPPDVQPSSRETLFEQITGSPRALAEYLRKIQACPMYSCSNGQTPDHSDTDGLCYRCLLEHLMRR